MWASTSCSASAMSLPIFGIALKLIGHHVPLRPSGFLAGLGKDGANERETTPRWPLGACTSRLRMKCTRQRCQVAEITFASPP